MWEDLNNFIDILKPLFSILSGNILSFLLILAGISLLTVAIVDFIKPYIRPFEIKKHFRQWFNPPNIKMPLLPAILIYVSLILEYMHIKKKPDLKALESLISKSVGSNYEYFYMLKIDLLFEKLDVAVNSVLDYPDKYTKELLIVLSGYDPLISNEQHITDIESILSGPDNYDEEKYLKSLTRLNRQIDGNLSIFKSNLKYRWARNLHILSFFISFIIILLSFSIIDAAKEQIEKTQPAKEQIEKTQPAKEQIELAQQEKEQIEKAQQAKGRISLWSFIVLAILGAFLAPVAHNLTVAIRGAKETSTR